MRGKLEMIVKTFFSEHFQPDLSQPNKEALLVYHDDSSDELNDKLDEMLLPASNTDYWYWWLILTTDTDTLIIWYSDTDFQNFFFQNTSNLI